MLRRDSSRCLVGSEQLTITDYGARPESIAGIREEYARHPSGCGMPAVAAGIIFLALTAIQLLVGVSAQLVLSARRRRKVSSFST